MNQQKPVLAHHVGYNQNNLRKYDQNYGAYDARDEKKARTFKNGSQVNFRRQGFNYKYIDPYRRGNRTHGGYHGDNYGKPDGIKSKGFTQWKKDWYGENQESKGVDETAADQIYQQDNCQYGVRRYR